MRYYDVIWVKENKLFYSIQCLNWDPPTPSFASECVPPPPEPKGGGGHARLRVRGGEGVPIWDDRRKSLALCLPPL
jgi:hypothetical protein